jgi:hypothetical protein
MKTWLVEILAVCVLGSLVFTTTSHASTVTDPRKCSRATPGDQAHHGYWCAKWAAVDTVRVVMARRQSVARWYPAVFCDQGTTLLRWSCQTFLGGDHWKITLRWTATSTGWHRYTTVTKTL